MLAGAFPVFQRRVLFIELFGFSRYCEVRSSSSGKGKGVAESFDGIGSEKEK